MKKFTLSLLKQCKRALIPMAVRLLLASAAIVVATPAGRYHPTTLFITLEDYPFKWDSPSPRTVDVPHPRIKWSLAATTGSSGSRCIDGDGNWECETRTPLNQTRVLLNQTVRQVGFTLSVVQYGSGSSSEQQGVATNACDTTAVCEVVYKGAPLVVGGHYLVTLRVVYNLTATTTLLLPHVTTTTTTETTTQLLSATTTIPFMVGALPGNWSTVQWIGGHNQLRTEFTIADDVPLAADDTPLAADHDLSQERAAAAPAPIPMQPVTLFVTSLGCNEVYLNGALVG
jgi:hypothetical protein